MINIATDLKERFDFAAIWFLDRSDVMQADLSEEDAKAVDILTNLRDSADAIPPSLIDETERLRIGPGLVREQPRTGCASSWLRLLSGHCYGICRSAESNCSTGRSLRVSEPQHPWRYRAKRAMWMRLRLAALVTLPPGISETPGNSEIWRRARRFECALVGCDTDFVEILIPGTIDWRAHSGSANSQEHPHDRRGSEPVTPESAR